MDQAIIELQKTIVATIVSGMAGVWGRIVVSYEMQEEDGGLIEASRTAALRGDSRRRSNEPVPAFQ